MRTTGTISSVIAAVTALLLAWISTEQSSPKFFGC
jgi:hypothetical protein